MSITLNDHLLVPDEVLTARVGDELILLNLETGMYHGLDPVGTRFFELLEATGELCAVHRTMLDEFEVTAERLEAGLLRICEAMVARGLLVANAAPQE